MQIKIKCLIWQNQIWNKQTCLVCFLRLNLVNEWTVEHKKKKKKTGQAGKTKLNEEKLYVPGNILEIKGKYKSNWENAFWVGFLMEWHNHTWSATWESSDSLGLSSGGSEEASWENNLFWFVGGKPEWLMVWQFLLADQLPTIFLNLLWEIRQKGQRLCRRWWQGMTLKVKREPDTTSTF